jgi:S1-C subfamily serine protease
LSSLNLDLNFSYLAFTASIPRGGYLTITYNGSELPLGGDIILKIDNQSVSKMEEIVAYLSQKHAGDKVHFTIFRDNATKELDVILGRMP